MNRRDFLERAAALAGAVRFSRPQPALKSRLILLGTAGGPTPKKTRAAPAQIIVVGDRGYLVDCGNGVARQMQLAGVFGTLRHVFLTHHHSDHDADLGNVILLDWGTNLTTAVDVWGPPPVTRMMNLFFEMNQADLDVRVRDEVVRRFHLWFIHTRLRTTESS